LTRAENFVEEKIGESPSSLLINKRKINITLKNNEINTLCSRSWVNSSIVDYYILVLYLYFILAIRRFL
jgi:Ulp1 family protease